MHRWGWLFLALVVAMPARAQTSEPEFRVVTTSFPPYSMEVDGQVRGVAADLVQAVLDDLGVRTPIDVFPWARAYETALRGPRVLLFQIARTPERESRFKWVGEVASYDVHLYRRADRTEIAPTGLEEAMQWKIGGLLRDVKTTHLQERGVAVTTYSDEANGLSMLIGGRIDLMPSDRQAMLHRLALAGLPPDRVVPVLRLDAISSPLHMAFSLDTPDALVDRVRASLERVRAGREKDGGPS